MTIIVMYASHRINPLIYDYYHSDVCKSSYQFVNDDYHIFSAFLSAFPNAASLLFTS